MTRYAVEIGPTRVRILRDAAEAIQAAQVRSVHARPGVMVRVLDIQSGEVLWSCVTGRPEQGRAMRLDGGPET